MALTDKLTRLMIPWLRDDEQVLHAVPAFHLGGACETVATTFRTSGGAFAIAASRIGSGGTANVDPRTAGTLIELPQRCIVAVTEHRLLIFQNGVLTHKPVKLIVEYPLAGIAWVSAPVLDPGAFTKSERVIVGVPGPARLAWEFPRLYIETGRALMAELARLVAGPSAQSPFGESVPLIAGQWEPCKPRGLRTVLREAGGAIPPAYSPGDPLCDRRQARGCTRRSGVGSPTSD